MSTYLRARQIEELQSERRALQGMLGDPASQVQDRGSMSTQVRNIDRQIEKNAPPEVSAGELDALVKEEAQLRAELMEGMPSAEEMRKAPAGAVGKHQAWDARAKQVINESGDKRLDRWKNLRLRLNRGNPDPDIANFERFRPKTSTLGMHDTFIQDGATRSFASEPFKQGYDRMDWGNGGSQKQLEALQEEVALLREQVQERSKMATKKRKQRAKATGKDRVEQVEIEARCGKKLTPRKGRESVSLHMHARRCAECAKAVA